MASSGENGGVSAVAQVPARFPQRRHGSGGGRSCRRRSSRRWRQPVGAFPRPGPLAVVDAGVGSPRIGVPVRRAGLLRRRLNVPVRWVGRRRIGAASSSAEDATRPAVSGRSRRGSRRWRRFRHAVTAWFTHRSPGRSPGLSEESGSLEN